jgi:hypothetical protein
LKLPDSSKKTFTQYSRKTVGRRGVQSGSRPVQSAKPT